MPSYGSPDYSRSTGTYDPGGGPPQGPPVQPFSFDGGVPGFGGMAPGGGNHTLYSSGDIIATFPYTGPTPLPQSVIVTQSCVASWLSMSSGTPVIGTCDNGLGGPKNSYGPAPGPAGYTASGGQGTDSSGNPLIFYSVVAGASPLVLPTVTVKANVAGDAMSGQLRASVSYTSAVSPVYIALTGPTQDNSGNWNILIGQYCKASLSGIPSSCTVSNYQWGVTGPTLQTWQSQTPAIGSNPANLDATYEVDGPGRSDQPTAGWYWNEIGNDSSKNETVSCTATVTPPPGQGAAFTVTASSPVTVWSPKWTCTGLGGEVEIDQRHGGGNGTDYWMYAGPTPAELQAGTSGRGMQWNATVSAPTKSPVSFGSGSLVMTQLVVSWNESYVAGIYPTTHTDPNNAVAGLDTYYPYPWASPAPAYASGDSPGIDLTAFNATSASMDDTFEDYVLYAAPGSNQYVALGHFVWRTTANASIPGGNPGNPGSGNWANFSSGPAGTVTDSGRTTNFLTSNEFPSWTQIFTADSF